MDNNKKQKNNKDKNWQTPTKNIVKPSVNTAIIKENMFNKFVYLASPKEKQAK